ncbi:MAG: formylglycine-generating enzyme family protein [Haliscomenobacter sp.]|nr:formylglycine-generating enzyme family protein [Haliscomenobacter sp.]
MIGNPITADYLKKLEEDMVFVQGMKAFHMRSKNFSGGPSLERHVYIDDFSLCKYPVTQALWQAVMGDNPSYFKAPNRPVEQVSWIDVQTFLEKLNTRTGKTYRLPSEAEWQYAARGGHRSQGFTYSGGNKLNEVGWYDENSHAETKPVGLKQPNELGLYDMSGNVWEWCADVWHDNYEGAPDDGSAWTTGGDQDWRVVRGGSWYFDDDNCRVSSRDWYDSVDRFNNIGFRLAGY